MFYEINKRFQKTWGWAEVVEVVRDFFFLVPTKWRYLIIILKDKQWHITNGICAVLALMHLALSCRMRTEYQGPGEMNPQLNNYLYCIPEISASCVSITLHFYFLCTFFVTFFALMTCLTENSLLNCNKYIFFLKPINSWCMTYSHDLLRQYS